MLPDCTCGRTPAHVTSPWKNSRGHQDQLAIVFTHFEDVEAPDLNLAGRKAKVLEGLGNAIKAIASLPKAQRVQLELTAKSKTYFLTRMNRPEVKHAQTQAELNRLGEHIDRSAGQPDPPQYRPQFNEYAIANILQKEIETYRRDWSETEPCRKARVGKYAKKFWHAGM